MENGKVPDSNDEFSQQQEESQENLENVKKRLVFEGSCSPLFGNIGGFA